MMQVSVSEVFIFSGVEDVEHFQIMFKSDLNEDVTFAYFKKYMELNYNIKNNSEIEYDYEKIGLSEIKNIDETELKKNNLLVKKLPNILHNLPERPSKLQLINYIKIKSKKHRFLNMEDEYEHELWETIVKI